MVGSRRTGGGCTGTSNSIGESEGLLAVSFFFLSPFSPLGRDEDEAAEGD